MSSEQKAVPSAEVAADAAPASVDLSKSACSEQFAQLSKCSADNGEKAGEACAEISQILAKCKEDNGL